MREAASIIVINALLEAGAQISASDPEAMDEAKKIFGNKIEYQADNYAALNNADALLVLTEWNDFREPDFSRIKAGLKNPVVFDGRNIFNPLSMKEHGLQYYSIGRKEV